MKTFNNIVLILVICGITVSFSNCASSQKLKNPIPLSIGEAYYQDWASEIKGERSGYTIFIPVIDNPQNIMLDSVYFRDNKAKLEFINTVFIGRLKTTTINKQDIIMSNEPYAEYENKVPELPQKTPFNLNDNECMVSYLVNDEIKYFKIDGIIKK